VSSKATVHDTNPFRQAAKHQHSITNMPNVVQVMTFKLLAVFKFCTVFLCIQTWYQIRPGCAAWSGAATICLASGDGANYYCFCVKKSVLIWINIDIVMVFNYDVTINVVFSLRNKNVTITKDAFYVW